ncbi:molybdopterin-dependent oxidoreductase [Planctomycetota bacterium]
MNLPPNQQLISSSRWPVVGERAARADDAPWVIRIHGEVENECCFSLAELSSGDTFEIIDKDVDVHCVTRWSKLGMRFRGIRMRDLLNAATPTAQGNFAEVVARSDRNHSTSIPIEIANDAIIAFEANGEPLSEEHGGPVRVVVPGRYFYKSLKWLERIELLATDRLGFWESDAGYHNEADPWKEQRYIASSVSKNEAARLIGSGDFRRQDLRGLDCSQRTILDLNADESFLRDARFSSAVLRNASFRGSNLSNAVFDRADLRYSDFSGADIEGASFVGANLCGANLLVASMFGASFGSRNERGEVVLAAVDSTTRIDGAALASLTDEQLELFQLIKP